MTRKMKPFTLPVLLLLAAGLNVAVMKDSNPKSAPENSTTPAPTRIPQTLARGWGDDLHWVQTYEEGLAEAKKTQRTLMVIHHTEECPYSQALKKVFAANLEVQRLAKQFVMLNLVYPPTDKNQAPDGYYVPRIIFVDRSLTVRADIAGRYANRLYTYEPGDMEVLIANMKRALKPLHTEL